MPTRTERYVALLRGINVGGANLIPMTCAASLVRDAGPARRHQLHCERQRPLPIQGDRFTHAHISYRKGALEGVRLRGDGRPALPRADEDGRPGRAGGFGESPGLDSYDVVFVKEPLVPRRVVTMISTREGVDTAAAGLSVIYFSRLIARASQSHLPKLVSMPVYQQLTIRNWNTTTKLLALMAA